MPHIIVKLWPGKSEKQKEQFAEQIVKKGMEVFGIGEEYFSVDMQEVNPDEWPEKVYRPEIIQRQDKLYKKPGYKM